jgi:hypothetical protein
MYMQTLEFSAKKLAETPKSMNLQLWQLFKVSNTRRQHILKVDLWWPTLETKVGLSIDSTTPFPI